MSLKQVVSSIFLFKKNQIIETS